MATKQSCIEDETGRSHKTNAGVPGHSIVVVAQPNGRVRCIVPSSVYIFQRRGATTMVGFAHGMCASSRFHIAHRSHYGDNQPGRKTIPKSMGTS